MRYYIKGTFYTTGHSTKRTFTNDKGRKVSREGIFSTVKNPILCDKAGQPLSKKEVEKFVADFTAEAGESYTPKWVKELANGTEYANFRSNYEPVFHFGKDKYNFDEITKFIADNAPDGASLTNSEVVCYCKDSYLNHVNILDFGEETPIFE